MTQHKSVFHLLLLLLCWAEMPSCNVLAGTPIATVEPYVERGSLLWSETYHEGVYSVWRDGDKINLVTERQDGSFVMGNQTNWLPDQAVVVLAGSTISTDARQAEVLFGVIVVDDALAEEATQIMVQFNNGATATNDTVDGQGALFFSAEFDPVQSGIDEQLIIVHYRLLDATGEVIYAWWQDDAT